MDTLEYRTIDKSKWRAGPWLNEPDKRQWQDEATGLPCLIVRNGSGGHLCGYVGVPASHPLHGKSYSDRIKVPDRNAVAVNPSAIIPLFLEAMHEDDGMVSIDCLLNVHGGITYAEGCSHGDEAKSICHKPGEGEPDDVWWFGFDCAHCDDVSPAWSHQSGEYRDWQYVEHETRKLAAQLAALA